MGGERDWWERRGCCYLLTAQTAVVCFFFLCCAGERNKFSFLIFLLLQNLWARTGVCNHEPQWWTQTAAFLKIPPAKWHTHWGEVAQPCFPLSVCLCVCVCRYCIYSDDSFYSWRWISISANTLLGWYLRSSAFDLSLSLFLESKFPKRAWAESPGKADSTSFQPTTAVLAAQICEIWSGLMWFATCPLKGTPIAFLAFHSAHKPLPKEGGW